MRTTKNDLGLKQPIFHEIKVEMSIEHQELYEKVKNWYKENIGSLTDMYTLRKLKGCVMYLLQLTSNPMIVSNDEFLETVRNLGLENVLHEYSTKFNLVIDKVRELTSKNEKGFNMDFFTKNIDLLERELIDLNPVIIDGRVEVGESEEIGTRKGNIENLKNDPTYGFYC